MKSQIKHRYTESVLYECELPDDTPSGMVARLTLEKATTNGANLRGANLEGAFLGGANLRGANLEGKKLIGPRPIFQIGPIGSRSDYFISYTTDAGIMLKAGCFTGTIEEFEEKLTKEHGDNNHAQEYRAALELIKTHETIWKDEK